MLARTAQRLSTLERRVRNYFLLDTAPEDLVRLGSGDAGWWLPASVLQSSTVAACAGADVTFDIALAGHGLTIYTIDPMAEGSSLRALMERHHISHVDILKLDIAGAEYAVLDQMIADRILPECLLVEFHQGRRFMAAVAMLKRHRYQICKTAQWRFTFVRMP
jgi:hypothetical protein